MHWQYFLPFLIDQSVAIEFVGGGGASGKLCRYDRDGIYLIIYQHPQFVTMNYMYSQIRNIVPFPSCHPIPTPY